MIAPTYGLSKTERIKYLEQEIERLQQENKWLRKLLDDVTAMARQRREQE